MSAPLLPPLPPDAPHTLQRLKLLQNGYLPVPVTGPTVACNKPGKATLLQDWRNACASADEDAVRRWQFSHPGHTNTGILCGAGLAKVRVADIDVLTTEASERLVESAARRFGVTPLQRVGLAPKILLMYRTETPIAKDGTAEFKMPDGTKAQVEILCAGQQFVAFGIHPDTGQPYRWLGESPETVCAADLPILREQDVAAFLAEAEAILIDCGGKLLFPERAAPRVMRPAEASARPYGTNDELIARIKAGESWHNNTLSLTARWFAEGKTEEQIIAFAPELTIGDYSVDETEAEIRKMIKGARKKSYDKYAPAPLTEESAGLFTPLPDPAGDSSDAPSPPDSGATNPPALVPRSGRRRTIAECFRYADDCRNMPRDYLVKHILSPGDVAVLVGQPGHGKSILAPYIGYAVAQGREVFGLRVRQGRVLYVTAEDERGMSRRVDALRLRYRDTGKEFAMCSYDSLKSAGFDELRAHVEEWLPKLVIIDTLVAAWPDIDETSFPEMGLVYTQAKALTTFGCAVLVVHHPPKDNNKVVRGAGNLNGSVDVVLTLNKAGDVVSTTFGKNRNGTSDRTLAFRIGVMTLGIDEDGDPITAPIADEVLTSGVLARVAPLLGQKRQMVEVLASMCASGGKVAESDWLAECSRQRVSTSPDEKSRMSVLRRVYGVLVARGHVLAYDGAVQLGQSRNGKPQETGANRPQLPETCLKPSGENQETMETTPYRVVPGLDVVPVPVPTPSNSNEAAPLRQHSPLSLGGASVPAAEGLSRAAKKQQVQQGRTARQRPPKADYGAFAAPSGAPPGSISPSDQSEAQAAGASAVNGGGESRAATAGKVAGRRPA